MTRQGTRSSSSNHADHARRRHPCRRYLRGDWQCRLFLLKTGAANVARAAPSRSARQRHLRGHKDRRREGPPSAKRVGTRFGRLETVVGDLCRRLAGGRRLKLQRRTSISDLIERGDVRTPRLRRARGHRGGVEALRTFESAPGALLLERARPPLSARRPRPGCGTPRRGLRDEYGAGEREKRRCGAFSRHYSPPRPAADPVAETSANCGRRSIWAA
jgi:hypothetical protein